VCSDKGCMTDGPVAVLVGVAYWDTMCDVPALPIEGSSVYVRHLSWAAGGLGRPAVALARFFDTHLYVPIADDYPGQLLSAEIGAAGVHIHAGSCPHTPMSTALTGGVDRTCISGRPSTYGTANLNDMNDAEVRVVFGDGNNAEAYCELADRHPDALCSVDVGASIRPGSAKAAWMADVVCGHTDTLVSITRQDNMDDAARVLLQGQASLVVVTNGPEGATAWDAPNGRWHTPAPAVEARDAVGCGDLFHASLVTQLAHGIDTKDAIETAVMVASAFATTWGNDSLTDGSVLQPVVDAVALHAAD
jgi:sugar/nucleoside kinase (ribokinase family)